MVVLAAKASLARPLRTVRSVSSGESADGRQLVGGAFRVREEGPVRREPEASYSKGRTPEATRSDRIREILDDLIRQRQSLRLGSTGEEPGLLEANRRS